jgi:hypothetical protein
VAVGYGILLRQPGQFFVNGLGLCMMQGDEIIVEAYVSSFGDTQAEVGAVTRAAYRGHGYAPV